MYRIPFNKPHFTGKEQEYLLDALEQGKLSSNGKYTGLCQDFFQQKYGFGRTYLTNSCTQALEMAALILDIQPADEIIIPSYTFVSTANAFALRGAKIVFADSNADYPCMDMDKVSSLVTARTKAIVVVHYGGIACDMRIVMELADKHGLYVIEDAAAALDAFYLEDTGEKRALGTIGHFAAFSFHETKNISSGEGGMLAVNEERFFEKATQIWEKGTNRTAYYRNEVNRYEWVSLGSAFGPSEITAACLWAQVQDLEAIQSSRKDIWEWYDRHLNDILDGFHGHGPYVPDFALHNYHIYYLVAADQNERDRMIRYFKEKGILAVFHYQCLHLSPFYKEKHGDRKLPQAEKYGQCLLRMPFYYGLDTGMIAESLST